MTHEYFFSDLGGKNVVVIARRSYRRVFVRLGSTVFGSKCKL